MQNSFLAALNRPPHHLTTSVFIRRQFGHFLADAPDDLRQMSALRRGRLPKVFQPMLNFAQKQAASLLEAGRRGADPPRWFQDREAARHARLVRAALERGQEVPSHVIDSVKNYGKSMESRSVPRAGTGAPAPGQIQPDPAQAAGGTQSV